jgi:hypothetical protein
MGTLRENGNRSSRTIAHSTEGRVQASFDVLEEIPGVLDAHRQAE